MLDRLVISDEMTSGDVGCTGGRDDSVDTETLGGAGGRDDNFRWE
jgi:hypothetical protein